jgi:hypothetical protein
VEDVGVDAEDVYQDGTHADVSRPPVVVVLEAEILLVVVPGRRGLSLLPPIA